MRTGILKKLKDMSSILKEIKIQQIRKPIKASIQIPGSKSYTNRAFLIASLAEGKSIIKNALLSDDTIYCYKALKQLGINIKKRGTTFKIEGTTHLSPNPSPLLKERKGESLKLYLGNAGTAVRFLSSTLTLFHQDTIITGNQRMQNRPIDDLVESLKILGVEIEYLKKQGFPPILIHGKGLNGGKTKIKGNKSSQFLSGLLITSPFAKKTIEIEIEGELVSKPYVDMTIEIMKEFGVKVENQNYKKFIITSEQKYYSKNYEVEADASSASYFFGIAAANNSEITVTNLNKNSLQADIHFLDVLEKMGCEIKAPLIKGVGGLNFKGSYISYNSKLKEFAKQNRNNPTRPESKIWYEILCEDKLNGYRFLRQKPINNFILDFYCSKLLLGIEIDGESHSEQIEYDHIRTELLNNYNIKIIRYSNNEVMENIEGVYEDLNEQIKNRKKELKSPKSPLSRGLTLIGPKQHLSPLGTINLNHMPDSAMTVAVLCTLAKGKSTLTGLANLRLKECDRLKALTTELTKIGAKIKEFNDGLEIIGNPEKLHGAEIETYDDHRMAMCFAVLGTKIPGIIIKNPDCVKKTYPGFWEELKKIN
ncbi:MAG: 3-phosphoshikimate 1-carboxyvinyltransferase, 3-phosphoshikimate 1-carboxyvinyltransferase [Candidatus Peregrinibacteria bacterium GW2011_GWF2_33_10]|nr:MAG: 3-phosphoshikimate 1-carboxyvinyltransferase, 3-phosphoshikimate 1-carboxyvinyltransferase [Candidatus Peregrinibacteria bacterium GW2011_GWF2_33_10]